MAQRIAAAGVEAIPAYVHLPESGKVPEPTLDAAVKASGADALVMSRVRQIDRRMMVGRHELAELAEPLGDFVEHGTRARGRHILFEARRSQRRRPPDSAGVGRDLAGDDFQQAGFP